MKKENITQYIGKKVRILLKNNNNYTVLIESVDEDCFSGVDKYGENITIDNNEVSVITKA